MTRVIDPKVEQQTREMLGHAIRGELPDLAALIQAVGDEAYRHVIGLCLVAAAYVAVDTSERWPTEADVQEISRIVASKETVYDLEQEEVHDYLSRAALGFESLEVALGGIEAAATLPVLITGSLVFRFCPRGKEWWEYLDQIWSAILTSENLDESVVPAVQVRAHRTQILKARGAAAE
jgi:hypothetical protein